jgi:hypothetical protein
LRLPDRVICSWFYLLFSIKHAIMFNYGAVAKMQKMISAIIGASLAASVPAQAASTIVYSAVTTALDPTLTIFNNFSTITGGTRTGQTVVKTTGTIPTGFDGNYLQVKGATGTNNPGYFTQTLSTSAQAFSFLFSDVTATGTSLKLNFVGGGSETFNLYTAAGNRASGRLTIYRNGGTNPNISSVVFGSVSSSVLYNIDSLASAAPEPAAWALMLIGFGMAGAALRRRSGVSAET